MPVILDPENYDLLDPGTTNVEGGIRTAEALRCSPDAVLSSEQSRQSCWK
jgi:hypothetical protein